MKPLQEKTVRDRLNAISRWFQCEVDHGKSIIAEATAIRSSEVAAVRLRCPHRYEQNRREYGDNDPTSWTCSICRNTTTTNPNAKGGGA